MEETGSDTGGKVSNPVFRDADRPLEADAFGRYAGVVRRASFWNWAGTHHLRK